MRAYAENVVILLTFTDLRITRVILQNGDDGILSETLRRCTNLKKIDVLNSNVTDEQLVPMIEEICPNSWNNFACGEIGLETCWL